MAGLDLMGVRGGWSPDQIETLREMWTAGEGTRRISIKTNRSVESVRDMRARLGLPARESTRKPDHIWPEHKRERFKREWRAGRSLKWMAETFDINPRSVDKMRKHLGLDPRNSRWSPYVESQTVHLRLTPEIRAKAAKAAFAASMSLSTWIARTVQARLEV